MKFFLSSLLLIFVPFFITTSSCSNGIARNFIDELSSFFFDEPISLIFENEDLYSLCSFTDDLEPVLESALKHNPSISAFDLSALVLEDLKEKLMKIRQFESKAGKSIYSSFLNHFSVKYSGMGDFKTFSPTSNSSFKGHLSIPEISKTFFEPNPNDAGLEYLDCIFGAEYDSAINSLSDLKSSDNGNLSGKKRSSTSNDEMWIMAGLSLSVLPSKIFEFSQNIVNPTESLSYLSALAIYDHLMALFNQYISLKVPYTADTIKNDFRAQAIAFIKTLGSASDERIKTAFVDVLVECAGEINSEIRGFKINGEKAEIIEEDEDFAPEMKRKRSKGPSTTLSPVKPNSPATQNNSETEQNPDDFFEAAHAHELNEPQNIAIFDDPLETVRAICINQDISKYCEIRGLYWALLERDFPGMKEKGELEFVQSTVDDSIISAFRS